MRGLATTNDRLPLGSRFPLRYKRLIVSLREATRRPYFVWLREGRKPDAEPCEVAAGGRAARAMTHEEPAIAALCMLFVDVTVFGNVQELLQKILRRNQHQG